MTRPNADAHHQPAYPPPQRSESDAEQYTDAFNLLTMAQSALRGRMILAAVAGAVLAVPCALVGYHLTERTYQSNATIAVQANADTLLYSDVGASGVRLESYLEQQTEIARSQRVLELAVENPELVEIGWPQGVEGQRALRAGLGISFKRRDSTFDLIMVHPDELAVEVAVRAVTQAYMELVAEQNSTVSDERQLDDTLRRLDAQISNIQANIAASTESFGNTDLTAQIRVVEQRSFEIKERIDALDTQITLREEAKRGAATEDDDPAKLTVEQLAFRDKQLEAMLSERTRIRTEIDEKSESLGSRHPLMKSLERDLTSLTARIEDRANTVRERILNLNPGENPEALTLDQLRSSLTIAKRQEVEIDRRLRDLNETWADVQGEQEQLDQLREQRREIARQKSMYEVERDSLRDGRISVITAATPATLNDDKRKMLAAVGGFGGGFTGVALVAAWGIYRRTFRFVDDVDNPDQLPPLLGTLPELDRKDPEVEQIAAISVHNLRNMLHTISQYSDERCQVIVCTSAEPGDGKTTLVQSLGASYALTGLRTIVVDMDLVGSGLTSRLGMTGRRGMADLLGGLEPTKCIKRTATEKLYALPAGDANACRPEQLAHRPVQQVIDWLRERFDVVLMDTGPVLGSLEAGLSANLADQVLLVVPRGQPNRLAKAAINRLSRVGAKRVGLVFNRALAVDLRQSLSAASIGAPSTPRPARRPIERRLDEDASIVGSIPPPDLDQSLPPAEGGSGR